MESEINLHELIGLDMGRILHSADTYSNIIDHIAHKMRKKLISEIVQSESKISILDDESTTISNISSLIIFVRTCLPNHGMNFPVNFFLDLCELKEGVKAANVFSSLMDCLQFNKIPSSILKIILSYDDAAVYITTYSTI